MSYEIDSCFASAEFTDYREEILLDRCDASLVLIIVRPAINALLRREQINEIEQCFEFTHVNTQLEVLLLCHGVNFIIGSVTFKYHTLALKSF